MVSDVAYWLEKLGTDPLLSPFYVSTYLDQLGTVFHGFQGFLLGHNTWYQALY